MPSPILGRIAQRQEATHSKCVQYGFESHCGYFDILVDMRTQKFGTEYHREYYQKRKQAIYEYLGGQCVSCGSNQDLQIDHIDRSAKIFDISRKLSLKNNKAEIDKCQLLCKPCHLAKTAEENIGFTHGTMYGWMKKKCQCDLCDTEKRRWQDERNAKRRKK